MAVKIRHIMTEKGWKTIEKTEPEPRSLFGNKTSFLIPDLDQNRPDSTQPNYQNRADSTIANNILRGKMDE